MKSFFSDKGISKRNITLIEGNAILTEDIDVANTLNSFFEKAVKGFGITEPEEYIEDVQNISDPIETAIAKFKCHSNIKRINKTVKKGTFSFSEVDNEVIDQELKRLDPKKSNSFNNIPAKLLKEHRDICTYPLFNIINESIRECIFDDRLKLVDITPIHKRMKPQIKLSI